MILADRKKRINLTVEDDMFETLDKIAKKEKMSVSSVSNFLLAKALELQEDFYFSKVGEARLSKEIEKAFSRRYLEVNRVPN